MAWFYGLGKFRKEQILTSGFVFFVLAKTMILVSLLNDIKLKIHIGHLTLATDFADLIFFNFGRFRAVEGHFKADIISCLLMSIT